MPNAENHTKLRSVGISSTTVKNSRMVRPLEILAINTPTNGDHDTHHTVENRP